MKFYRIILISLLLQNWMLVDGIEINGVHSRHHLEKRQNTDLYGRIARNTNSDENSNVPSSQYNRLAPGGNSSPGNADSEKDENTDPQGKFFGKFKFRHPRVYRRRHYHQFIAQDPCRQYYKSKEGKLIWDLNLVNVYSQQPGQYSGVQADGNACNSNLYNNPASYSGYNPGGGAQGYYDQIVVVPPRPLFPFLNFVRPPIYSYQPQVLQSPAGGSNNVNYNGNNNNNNNNNDGGSSGSSVNNDVYDAVYENGVRPVYNNNNQNPVRPVYNNNNQIPVRPLYDQIPVRPGYPNRPFDAPQTVVYQGDRPFLTPGQVVGGIANTVNHVIQTLSGNIRPVTFLRSLFE